MTSYAALVSLFNTLDQIHNHPHFLSFDLNQIQSLSRQVDILLDFVESYNIDGVINEGAEELKRRIVSAAHEAEDIIESQVVDLILPGSSEISDVRLQEVLRDIDSINEVVLKFKEASKFNFLKPSNSMLAVVSSTSEHNGMVGSEEELKQLMESIIVPKSSLQIVSIDGMGGTDLQVVKFAPVIAFLEKTDDFELGAIKALAEAADSLIIAVGIFRDWLSIDQAIELIRFNKDLVEDVHDHDIADLRVRISSAAEFLGLLKKH